MKTIKLILSGAVVTALLPLTSLAAIDDQGMQYVSAAEGLHGSMRVDILKNVDKDTSDETTGGGKNSLRLWVTGSGDIGGGWATTYYWEVRDGDPGASGTLGTNAWTLGLKGPIGAFDFGKSAMVAPRMVPGGSLDTVAGGNAAHFACDNTHRFESATFNGFQLGVSAVTNGSEVNNEDDLIDEYSVAVKYTSPLGFQVGAGYEVDIMHEERFSGASFADYDDRNGWRVGARYGQDNWLLAYEYRTYEGFSDFGNLNVGALTSPVTATVERNNSTNTVVITVDAATGGWFNDTQVTNVNSIPADFSGFSQGISAITDGLQTNLRPNAATSTDFYSKISYAVHRTGIQIKLERITASAGYSRATEKLDLPGAIDLDQTALAVDAAYHLGLNSLIAVGWKKVTTESYARGGFSSNYAHFDTALDNASRISRSQKATETTTQLYYRVDF